MRRYAYRCRFDGHEFDSDKPQEATCPICGKPGRRVYASTPLYHPTKGDK